VPLRILPVMLYLLIFLGLSSPAFTADIMPLKDLKPGMIGEVKTVFKGTEIRSFPVEILSVIRSARGGRPLILVRAYGPLIDKIGGIAAGMSGSPVYVNGKIIGAIGYGWDMSNHRLGLVTPIEEMMKIWDRGQKVLPPEYDVILRERKVEEDKIEEGVRNESEEESEEKDEENRDKERIVMFATGLSPRGLSLLNSDFERYGVRVVSVPFSGEIKVAEKFKLEPGAAIGALLSCGDINVGAIGTLSYIDGSRFLAFAHPLLLRGKVSYFLTTAYIHECIPSIKFPFKLGTPGDIIGIVTQDRLEAIGGSLRQYPLSIPIKFNVKSVDDGKERTSFVRVVYDDGILEDLLKVILLSTFDLGWGKMGEGTVKLRYVLEGKNMPYPLERVNYFYSPKDVAKEAFEAFKSDFFNILYNEFSDIFPLGVTIEAEFTSYPKILWIKDVKLTGKDLERGKSISVDLTLLPHRGKSLEKKVEITIPKDFPEGEALLLVRGGGIAPQGKGNGRKEEPKVYKSLKEIVDEIKKQENNNEIIVEVIPRSGDHGDESDGKRGKKREAKVVFDTDFYVEGYIEKEVNVK